MNLDERLENVSIVGAAGKMGSGITVLILQEMTKLKIKNKDKIYRLNLIDINENALDGLYKYIKEQMVRVGEKGIVELRKLYEDRNNLIENYQIINAFVEESLEIIRRGTDINMAKNSKMLFEAIIENEDIKIDLLKKIKNMCSEETFYFTNTSSIPIGFLEEKTNLDGRIIGYHFYNPPVVQRLVELIPTKNTKQELKDISYEMGKRLRKTLVLANDISGFIGNGHFIRDGLYGIQEATKLKDKYGWDGAIYIINKITQEFLIRPMGIFQLIDYVGIDVFQCILNVMRKHLKDDTLHSDLIDKMVNKKVLGGQNPDGSQKDGFLSYKGNTPVGVYNIETNKYTPLEENWINKINKDIGKLPEGFIPWKMMLVEPKKEEKLSVYFDNLKKENTFGAKLAVDYLINTKNIAKKLIKDGVANSEEDVNAVLTNGFYWVYGPINNYI